MTRIACFYVPMFALAARLRSEPMLNDAVVAIIEGNAQNAHVLAATKRARIKGVRPGMSLAQARALVPKLMARARDNECERTAQEALFEVAETFSPRVEDAGEGIVYVDITGMERHFDSELSLAKAAIAAAEKMGLITRVGIAASKLAARVAAELPKSPTIVDPGQESEFLAPLPLSRLTPELDAATTLGRWGIGSIGELASLPENEVASRLGDLGRELHHAARGIDPRPLIPRPLPPDFREGTELEWPLLTIEPFLFIISPALDRLMQRMETQGFACKRLELTMMLDPDGFHARAIDLPAPTRDVHTMITLLRLDLEKSPPGAPVVGFSIVAHPDRPRRAQLTLFGPEALSPEKVATTIARLVALLGDDRVGMAMAVDGHLPERFEIGQYAPPAPPQTRVKAQQSRGLLAIRVFRPPVAVEVITTERDGKTQIASINGEGDLSGAVRLSSGPWRVESDWWTDAPAAREYWDVELERGGVYRVYQAATSSDWFIDGRYD